MPLAACLLDVSVSLGEAVRLGCGFGSGLGEVTCELGLLADVVEAGGLFGQRGGVMTAVPGVPVVDEGDQAGFGESMGLSGLEGVEQIFEDQREL